MPTHTHSHTYTHTYTHTHSHSHSHTYTHSHSLTHSLIHSFTHSLTHSHIIGWNIGYTAGFGTYFIAQILVGFSYCIMLCCIGENTAALCFPGGSYGLTRVRNTSTPYTTKYPLYTLRSSHLKTFLSCSLAHTNTNSHSHSLIHSLTYHNLCNRLFSLFVQVVLGFYSGFMVSANMDL